MRWPEVAVCAQTEQIITIILFFKSLFWAEELNEFYKPNINKWLSRG